MADRRPEVTRAMESEVDEKTWRFASELVMCSTCSGFVFRKPRKSMDPDDEEVVGMVQSMDPDEEEVVEVLIEAQKMRDLMQAMLLHGPLQEKEPAEATKEQWQVLRRRRLIMMETKRCPACSRSLLDMCPTCSRSLSEEDKAAGSKEEEDEKKKKRSTEDEAMVAIARSVKKSKRSREEGKRSSSGLKKKKKKKAKSEDKERSRSEKKAKRSREKEDSGSKETEMEDTESQKEAKMEVRESAGQYEKTKMVTRRLDKKSIDILKNRPPVKPLTFDTHYPFIQSMFANQIARYEVDCEFHEYLQRQSLIRGYAEYQLEVTDDEDE